MAARNPDPPAHGLPEPGSHGLLSRLREYLGFPVVDTTGGEKGEGSGNGLKQGSSKRPLRSVVPAPWIVRPVQPKRRRTADDVIPEMEKSLQEYLQRRLEYRREAERMRGRGPVRTSKPAHDRAERTHELEELLAASKKMEPASSPPAAEKVSEPTNDDVSELLGEFLPAKAPEKEAGARTQRPDVETLADLDVPGLGPAGKAPKIPAAGPSTAKVGLLGALLRGIRDLRKMFERSDRDIQELKKAVRQAPPPAAAETPPASPGRGRILSAALDAKPSTPRLSAQPAPPATAADAPPDAQPSPADAPGPGNEGFLSSLLENFGKEGSKGNEGKKGKEGKEEKKSIDGKDAKKEEIKKEEPKKADAKPASPPKKSSRIRLGGFAEFFGAIKYIGMGRERLAIVQNLATMLNAGLPLVDSIRTLQMETKTKPAKKLLQRIVESVESGNALWRAMEEQHFFSPHAIALIRIGEEAGNLAENMAYLAIQQEKDAGLRAKVKMAMIYPTIVLVLMFVIVIGLGMFVLPNLIQVLFSLNVKLPLVTRMVIAFTNGFTQYGKIVIPSTIGGVLLLVVLGKFTPLRIVSQWVIFHIPGIGRLATEATIARFGVILGGLLQAGVPLVDALRSLAEVTPIVRFRKFYVRLLEHINLGDSFAKSFATIRGSAKVIPVSVQQLIITGERTGSLAKIMLKIADIYEKKANDTAQKLPVILEPMLLLFIGSLVGTIAFAIIIPIYSIVGNVGQ